MEEKTSRNFDFFFFFWHWLTVGLTRTKSSSMCVICCILVYGVPATEWLYWMSRRFCMKMKPMGEALMKIELAIPFGTKEAYSCGHRGTGILKCVLGVCFHHIILWAYSRCFDFRYDTDQQDEILSLTEVPSGYDRLWIILNSPGVFLGHPSNCWDLISGERWQ